MELLLGRGAQVHPDHGVGLVEVLRDVGDGKALGLERALAVHPGPGIAHAIPPPHRSDITSAIGRWRSGRLCLAAHAVAPGVDCGARHYCSCSAGPTPANSTGKASTPSTRTPLPRRGRITGGVLVAHHRATRTPWSAAAATGQAARRKRAHDYYSSCRRALRRRGITPRVARRGVESTTRLGRHRRKVERSLAWLLANRRLTVRYERPRRPPPGALAPGLRADLRPQAPTDVNHC